MEWSNFYSMYESWRYHYTYGQSCGYWSCYLHWFLWRFEEETECENNTKGTSHYRRRKDEEENNQSLESVQSSSTPVGTGLGSNPPSSTAETSIPGMNQLPSQPVDSRLQGTSTTPSISPPNTMPPPPQQNPQQPTMTNQQQHVVFFFFHVV